MSEVELLDYNEYLIVRKNGWVGRGIYRRNENMFVTDNDYVARFHCENIIPLDQAIAAPQLVDALVDALTYIDVDNLTMQTKMRQWMAALEAKGSE